MPEAAIAPTSPSASHGEAVPEPAGHGLLGRGASLFRAREEPAQPCHVLVVLREQHGKHAIGRYEAPEPAALVHDGEAALAVAHHAPGSDLLIGPRGDHGRIRIHDLAQRGLGRHREEALDRDEADESVTLADGHIVCAVEALPGEREPHVTGQAFGFRARNGGGQVLRRCLEGPGRGAGCRIVAHLPRSSGTSRRLLPELEA
jgi:hypothetical protein